MTSQRSLGFRAGLPFEVLRKVQTTRSTTEGPAVGGGVKKEVASAISRTANKNSQTSAQECTFLLLNQID